MEHRNHTEYVIVERRAGGCSGCLTVLLGVCVVMIGIPMLVCPGPGIAAILMGLGMIGTGLGVGRTCRRRDDQS